MLSLVSYGAVGCGVMQCGGVGCNAVWCNWYQFMLHMTASHQAVLDTVLYITARIVSSVYKFTYMHMYIQLTMLKYPVLT